MRPTTIGSLFIATVLTAIGCNHGQPGEQPNPTPAPASQPERSQAPKAVPAESQGPVVSETPGLPPKKPGAAPLMGTFTISEVHDKGVVTMIPHQVATQITFIPDGTFSRVSKKQGKVNFKDSGQFVIEGQDQLILKIVMSDGKIQQTPVEKRHTFTLSEDGTELKMTGKDGKLAVFRR
jgi:hypothetical protein